MKNKYLIILILVLAFALRIDGINYGLPHFLIGDEQSMVAGALRMAEIKTLIPALHPEEFQLLYYPPLLSYVYLIYLAPLLLIKYLLGGFSGISQFKDYLILNPAFIWLAARLLIVFLGTASVYLIYLAGKKIFNNRTGLLAALLLAVSFFNAQLSHFTRHWIPACFFTLLLVYLSWQLGQKEEKKYFVLSGVIGGLAFGTTYVTAIAFLLPFFSYFFLGRGKFNHKLKNKNFWLMVGAFLLIAFVFIALYPQEFLKLTVGEDAGLKVAKSLIGLLGSFYYYFLNLFYFEPTILLFSLAGAIWLFLKDKKRLAFLLFYPIVYIFLFYFFLHQEVRYTSLIVPFFVLLAAYFIDFLLKNFFTKKFLAISLLFIVFALPLTVVLRYNWLLNQKDSRILAKDWLEKNIAENTKIITDLQGVKITPSKESIKNQGNLSPGSLRTIDRVLLNRPDEEYPHPYYNVLNLPYLSEKLPQDLTTFAKENGYQYFIVSYWQMADLNQEKQNLIRAGKLIKNFNGADCGRAYDINGNYQGSVFILFEMRYLGPIVEVYEL